MSRIHTRATIPLLAAWIFSGCETTPAPPPCVEDESVTLTDLVLEEMDPRGRARGLDLDGQVTTAMDEVGCHHDDFRDPDGTFVDAQGASFIPLVQAVYLIEVESVFRGTRIPLTMESVEREGVCGAAFSLPGGPSITAEWNGKTYRAHGLGDFPVVVNLPGASEEVTLHDVAVRVTIAHGRMATIVFGGGLRVDDLVRVARSAEPRFGEDSIRRFTDPMADLAPTPEGVCTQMSVSLGASP